VFPKDSRLSKVKRSLKGMAVIDRSVTVMIDAEKCVGCEACLQVCPCETLTMRDGKAVVTGQESLGCGHCAAVCPTEAIRVGALDNAVLNFETFSHAPNWLPPGESSLGELVQLMRSRRSCRNFMDQTVPLNRLEDLVKIGQTAPSGSNCQAWTFTILPTRDAVRQLSEQVGRFFLRLNRLAEKRLLRSVLKWVGRPELDFYYRNYFASIREGIQDWQNTGRDRLFHGATAVILVGGRSGAACPQEDALLAVQNMLLGAHAMGLGTCLIGFAVSAIERASSLKGFLKIPPDESIYAVIAVGYPDERYCRLPGRKPAPVRVWSGV
jgi:nitroreductase/Pyruvate/2-oxoacid:ferredoxin oxidoreductase delta subunit